MKITRLFVFLSFALTGATLFGQSCFDDNLRGTYGGLATLGVGATGTGTGTPTPTFSSSPIGNLLGAIAGNAGTSVSSTLYFDGAGRIFGSSTQSNFPQGVTGNNVGTYTVGSDCTVRVSFSDAFAAPTTPASTTTPTSLVGLVIRGGNEVVLAQLNPGSTETGAAGRFQRTAIRLVRFSNAYAAGCSLATLRGGYALTGEGYSTLSQSSGTGTGTGTTNNATVAPYYSTFLARVRFDGLGKLISDTSSGTPLATFQYTGTYTVNADCSGTMSITQSTTTGGTTGETPAPTNTSVRFLITSEQGFVDNRGLLIGQNIGDLRPGLIFTISNADQTINGVGYAQ